MWNREIHRNGEAVNSIFWLLQTDLIQVDYSKTGLHLKPFEKTYI